MSKETQQQLPNTSLTTSFESFKRRLPVIPVGLASLTLVGSTMLPTETSREVERESTTQHVAYEPSNSHNTYDSYTYATETVYEQPILNNLPDQKPEHDAQRFPEGLEDSYGGAFFLWVDRDKSYTPPVKWEKSEVLFHDQNISASTNLPRIHRSAK